ncbi:MAG: ATP-binding protein [Candidatus Wallbacteria bacterium]|nr:ATP-binding protein [Candidatus Wallbacteria bacterium]
MYITRTLEKYIIQAGAQFPVLLVTGARQVGKTTFLRHLCKKDRAYITLDDPMALTLAKEDPALFFQRFRPPLLIDEIQYAPELLPHIKMMVDQDHRSGAFWLTGSQQFHLMKGVSESLAGRVGVVQLLGLSRRELIGLAGMGLPFLPTPARIAERMATAVKLPLKDLYSLIWKGSFPVAALDQHMNRDFFYASYVQTYLQRDVRDLARVGDEMAFLRFLRTAAARTGQLLNLSELAKDADISPNTAKSWLSILISSGLVYLLEPWHSNLTKRLVKTPKLFFLDTGLCAYLTEWSSPENLEAGAMSGAILETWIIGELLKSYWNNGIRAPFYYYRNKDKVEIDLLIMQDGTVYPLEFKKTASPSKDDVRHFSALTKLNLPVGQGGIICLTEQKLPLIKTVDVIPVGLL